MNLSKTRALQTDTQTHKHTGTQTHRYTDTQAYTDTTELYIGCVRKKDQNVFCNIFKKLQRF